MYIPHPTKKRYKYYAIYVRIVFLGLHIFFLPFMLLLSLFLSKKTSVSVWRFVAFHVNRLFFCLVAIRINISKEILHTIDEPVVYISNHPSMLDGFMYYSVLGTSVMPLTQPADTLIFPFNIWFRRMDLIDIKRDDFDEHTSKSALPKQVALAKLVDCLRIEKKSVLIFPEGHTEKKHELEYIHTGAFRVAIRAQVPIVMCTITGFEKIYLDDHHMRPGVLTIHVSHKIFPPKVTRELPFRKAVKCLSDEFRLKFMHCLPCKYIPAYLTHLAKGSNPAHIGIFVDIDNTVYKGYSQKHFVRYMVKRGKLSYIAMLSIFYYIFLEKFHIISHQQLMAHAFSFTRGWVVQDMDAIARDFFQAEVVPHLFHDMLPPLHDHFKAGHSIFFITEVIEPLAKQFQQYFHARAVVATMIEKTKEGVYDGIIVRLCKGKEKKRQVERIIKKYSIDISKSYAYGDAYADIPMLSCVRYPCAVRPLKKMGDYACSHHWEIIG